MPTALETKPSMPLAPRLPSTLSPGRAAMNELRSRMGMLEAATSTSPSGTKAARSRAVRGSLGASSQSSRSSIADARRLLRLLP